MKKLLTGLLVLASFSSFATCNVFVSASELDQNFSTSFKVKAIDLAEKSLTQNGYNVVSTEDSSDLVLKLDITDGGDGSIMGAAVYLYPRGSRPSGNDAIFGTSKFSNTFELFNPINHARSKSRLKKMIKMIPNNDDVSRCI